MKKKTKAKAKVVKKSAPLKKPKNAEEARKIISAARKKEGEADNRLSKLSSKEKLDKAVAEYSGVVVSTEELAAQEARRLILERVDAIEEEDRKRWTKLGLVEVTVKGTDLKLLGPADNNKAPLTIAQRVEIAKRLNRVGPLLPRYISKYVNTNLPGKSTHDILNHATEYGGETMAEKLKRESLISKEMQAKMEAVGLGAMKVIAKHNPESASAQYLSGGKNGKRKAKAEEPVKGAKAKAPAAPVEPKKKAALTPAKVPAGGFNKTNKPATSGELIRALVMDHKLDDDQIATLTRKLFEGRNTKVSDVRWNRGQMRNAGINAPEPVGGEPQKAKKR